jgi:hypothetical protein
MYLYLLRIILGMVCTIPTAQGIEVYQFKNAIFPTNPGNFADHRYNDNNLAFNVGMGPDSDWGFGIVGGLLAVPNNLILCATLTGDCQSIDYNTFAGCIVDYHTPSGYLKRTAFSFPITSDKRDDNIPTWGKGTAPDQTTRLDPEQKQYRLQLDKDAPIGWDGIIWLSVMVENTGRNTNLTVSLDNINLQLESNPLKQNIAASPPLINWKTITLENRVIVCSQLEQENHISFDRFTQSLPSALESQIVTATTEYQQDAPTLIIGKLNDLHGILGKKVDEILPSLKDDKSWREEQGYLIKYYPVEDMLLATSLGNKGLTYAISHLQRTLVESPAPAIQLENWEMLEKPKTEERGIYINIGYGLSSGPITCDNWNETDWEEFIDQVVLSRFTFWSFYLWTEIEHIYPDSTRLDLIGKNQHVFKMLKHAIQYSHHRGLRAVYLFTPTNIPAEIIARHPEWKCDLEYHNSGGICSRHPEAYDLAKVLHHYQMSFLADADEYDITFYDPGGCMCEQCRQRDIQLQQIKKQVVDFSKMTWDINPKARFGFWTWAVWRYERIHKYSLNDLLIPQLAKELHGKNQQVVVIDSFHGDVGSVPYFEEAQQHGFRTSNFVYQTNIEDGHIFLLPLLDFQKKWAQLTQEKQLDETFLMIMEVRSKYPMAHFGGEFFWDANLSKETVTERYALQLSRNMASIRGLRDGLLMLDLLTYEGASGIDDAEKQATEMKLRFTASIKGLSPEQQQRLSWLRTSAEIYEILIRANIPKNEKNVTELAQLKQEFLATVNKEPLFSFFGQNDAEAFFERMVGWVGNGFRQGYY